MSTNWIIRAISHRNERRRDPAGTYLWAVISIFTVTVAFGFWAEWMGWL